ncbi:UDP-galactopyranose mutase [Clostridium sp. C8]|uniref:UDP-galactopyranose mutase n=1 Tax=Clostridium sp. C8 TaxID=1667357 RepID=UPI00062E4810|nr:UDP-galactopyranose mutase [Clostridium sp. C8]KLE15052.1 UDP-galactopyranose mutase [Clostridium sp. C8]
MIKKYDYLIVGAGLFGAIFTYEANKLGKKCLVIDKRNHTGGNIHCEKIENINVHKYGAHIFHTSNKQLWDYVNNLVEFNNYINCPIANYKGELYNLPFNMNTFYQLWKVKTPNEAKSKILSQIKDADLRNPKNLEEQAINLVGIDIYEKLIKGYTEKQWGRSAKELPSFIIKRLPVRFTFDNNYFNDKYQGIPIGGYNKIIDKLLKDSDIKLNVDFFDNRQELLNIADKILYTGMIDRFYDYRFDELEYRSLKFENKILDEENYQGNAVVNYTDAETPFTRIIEHKHFENSNSDKTVITKEYPLAWNKGCEAYYPINDERNNEIYEKYRQLAMKEEKVLFGGRLADYKYYDMDVTIKKALDLVKKELYMELVK